jgi:hypothetical protein
LLTPSFKRGCSAFVLRRAMQIQLKSLSYNFPRLFAG